MRLGISTCTYTWNFGRKNYPLPRNKFTVDTLLDKAASYSVPVLQILENIIPLHEFSEEALIDIGHHAADIGVELEIGTLGIVPSQLRKYLHIAKLMGASLVRTIMDGAGAHPSVPQGAGWIKDVMPEYHDLGIKLSIENHDLRKVAELKELMELVDDRLVGICLDMVNSLGAQECQQQVVETLLPYVNNVHYKDFIIRRTDYEMGFIVNGCIAGQGITDMDYIVSNRSKAKEDFDIILEQWMPWLGDIEHTALEEQRWADESIKFLQKKYFS